MDENTITLIAQHPEHCHECYRLICPDETYHQTAENTVLCPECASKGTSMEIFDIIQVNNDLAVEVGDDALSVRRGKAAVVVYSGEIRHLVDALVDGGVRVVGK